MLTACRSPPAAADLPVSSCGPAGYRPEGPATSLFLDIGQGAGLASASGIRPFLPPLLAGALARGDIGVDFSGTNWDFLESPGFLLVVFALAVIWYGAERSGTNRVLELGAASIGLALGALLFAGSLAEGGSEAWPGIFAGVACGALAWAAVGGMLERTRGRLAAQSGAARGGLGAQSGAARGGLAAQSGRSAEAPATQGGRSAEAPATGAQGARPRAQAGGPAGLLTIYAELAALLLAGLAILLPPVSFLALAAFVFLLVRGRREGERKYAGLRVLR
jgi:hypothetical protein